MKAFSALNAVCARSRRKAAAPAVATVDGSQPSKKVKLTPVLPDTKFTFSKVELGDGAHRLGAAGSAAWTNIFSWSSTFRYASGLTKLSALCFAVKRRV